MAWKSNQYFPFYLSGHLAKLAAVEVAVRGASMTLSGFQTESQPWKTSSRDQGFDTW